MSRAIAVALFALIALTASTLSAEANSSDSYTVQDGDSLLAIASKIGVPSDQLLDWVSSTVSLNGLSSPDDLTLGQVLKLPPTSSSSTVSQTTSTTTSTSTTAPSAKPVISGTGGTYTVADGDTLLGIAGKFSVPVDQQLAWVQSILATNNLASADQLAMGQVLTVPGAAKPAAAAASTSGTTSAPSFSPPTSSASASSPPTSASSTTSVSSLSAAPGGATSSSSSSSSATGVITGPASSYADYFNGRSMGCTGAGPYNPNDVTIVAVGPSMYKDFPCGTPIEVCGTKGCINAIRKDACPGCTSFVVDLSKAGLAAVCGPNTCTVRVRKV